MNCLNIDKSRMENAIRVHHLNDGDLTGNYHLEAALQ